MQIQKLKGPQRQIFSWRKRRNHMVCKLLDDNPRMLRADALRLANKRCGPMPGGKK